MNIQCQCGKSYTVPPTVVGKSVRCRACGNRMTVRAQSDSELQPRQSPPTSSRKAATNIFEPLDDSVPVEIAEGFQRACRLIEEGSLHTASVKLRRIQSASSLAPSTRDRVAKLLVFIEKKREGTAELAREYTESQDIDRLVALLDGPALNESTPEEVVRLCLELAERLCQEDCPEGAVVLLRINAIKSTRDKKLLKEYERVSSMADKGDRWKQFRVNAAIVGGTSVLGSAGLLFWAWIVWTSLAPMRVIAVPGMIVGALLLLTLPKFVPLLEKKLENSALQEKLANKFSKNRKN